MSPFFVLGGVYHGVMDQRAKLKNLVDLLPEKYVVLIWTKEDFKNFVDTLRPEEVAQVLSRIQNAYFPGEEYGFVQ